MTMAGRDRFSACGAEPFRPADAGGTFSGARRGSAGRLLPVFDGESNPARLRRGSIGGDGTRNAATTCIATEQLTLPALRSAESSIGIVHLGIGAFQGAHQAVYTEDAALATDDTSWGICGVTQRSASVRDQLVPQHGLYGVLTQSPTAPTALRTTGVIRDVLDAQTQQDELQVLLADPKVRVITLTATENGYRRGPDGRLNLTDPLVRADVDGNPQPTSAIGRLARGLQRRARQDAGPVTVLCCDTSTTTAPWSPP